LKPIFKQLAFKSDKFPMNHLDFLTFSIVEASIILKVQLCIALVYKEIAP